MTYIEKQIEEIINKVRIVEFLHGVPVSLPSETVELLRSGIRGAITQTLAEERERVVEAEESKNGAYKERDMLVCALSKLFPAYLARHSEDDKDWEDDWRWIVYIDLPTGQVSWHIHDSERELFNHLELKENKWDGHNTQRKYERLLTLSSLDKLTNNKNI